MRLTLDGRIASLRLAELARMLDAFRSDAISKSVRKQMMKEKVANIVTRNNVRVIKTERPARENVKEN